MRKSYTQASPLRLIKWCTQWQNKEHWEKVPKKLRGIYVLYNGDPKSDFYNVMYVGMAASGTGIRNRLRSHFYSKSKGNRWTHFSFFAVWQNIREEEIRELEALLQEIFRKDPNAMPLAKQKRSKKIRSVRIQKPQDWSRLGQKMDA